MIYGLSALLFFTLTGCRPAEHKITIDDLECRHATYKILAAQAAVEKNQMHAVPQLVKLLNDEDLSVRFYAIKALVNLVGEDHGYDYKADWGKRADAIKKWNDYLVENKERFKKTGEDEVRLSFR